MAAVTFSKDASGRITVVFQYDPLCVQKVKTIEGHRWHPEEKHWSFPSSDGILEKILKVFEGEEIQIDPTLTPQAEISSSPIRQNPTLAKPSPQSPSLVKRGEGRFSDKTDPSASPLTKGGIKGGLFEDLKRELLSRKYSYRTVKGYLYYNRDFLLFTVKNPSDINDNDIKDYLLYLAEERQSATSTLNQAINALKFYYSIMLKRKFLYEIKNSKRSLCKHPSESRAGFRHTFLLPESPFFLYILCKAGARQLLRLPVSGQFQSISRFGSMNP